MPRYILIDNYSGFIFADTADLPRHVFVGDDFPVSQHDLNITTAARWLDESVGAEFERTYEAKSRPDGDECGYLVYRADIDGSEAVPIVTDGQDREQIDAVISRCRYEGFVAVTRRAADRDAQLAKFIEADTTKTRITLREAQAALEFVRTVIGHLDDEIANAIIEGTISEIEKALAL